MWKLCDPAIICFNMTPARDGQVDGAAHSYYVLCIAMSCCHTYKCTLYSNFYVVMSRETSTALIIHTVTLIEIMCRPVWTFDWLADIHCGTARPVNSERPIMKRLRLELMSQCCRLDKPTPTIIPSKYTHTHTHTHTLSLLSLPHNMKQIATVLFSSQTANTTKYSQVYNSTLSVWVTAMPSHTTIRPIVWSTFRHTHSFSSVQYTGLPSLFRHQLIRQIR